jgi:capsular exopolysaccharide synthesis family protein
VALPPQPDRPADAAPNPDLTAVVPALPPAPPAKPARSRRATVLTGGVIGLIAGLAAGYDHFRRQPAVYESTAAVTGADPGAVLAPSVLDRAARRLDALQPFVPPLPDTTSARVAFLRDNVKLEVENGAARLAFRGPNPGDAPKYLRAVADAHAADTPPRPPLPPTPAPPAPAPKTPDPAPVVDAAAEREALRKELAAVTTEEPAAVEARLATNKTALAAARGKATDLAADLAAIDAAGTKRADRVAVMKRFGVTPDPEPPADPAKKELETQLVSVRQKKAELGRRLGPEHRDMVALDEQIEFVRERLAALAPKAPAEDELDRHRAKLAAAKPALDADAARLAAAVAKDEATLAAAAPIRAKLAQLPARAPQPAPAVRAQAPETDPPAPPPQAAASRPAEVAPPTDAVRVSPLLAASLVPGGGLGLLAGLVVGFLTSLGATAWANRPRRAPKAAAPPKPVVFSATVRRSGTTRLARYDGPALGVPVLGTIPQLRPELPVEKKSVEGWAPVLVSFTRPNGPEAEAFRAARRELVAALGSAGHKAVVVTSPGAGDGKTTTAANLALSLAQSGKRVVLVDCDYRGTKMQELFRLGRLGDSLKSVMLNAVDLRVAVRSCEVANLFLLPAGRNPVDGAELLTRAKFRELVAELKAGYEYVILDAPPTTAAAELKALADQTDGMVLVVRGGPDAGGRAGTATSEVAAAGGRVLGAIVTAAPPPTAAAPAAADGTIAARGEASNAGA